MKYNVESERQHITLFFENNWAMSIIQFPNRENLEVWPIKFKNDNDKLGNRMGDGPFELPAYAVIEFCDSLKGLDNNATGEDINTIYQWLTV